MKRYDLHTHPLVHKYFMKFDSKNRSNYELDEEDKNHIIEMIDFSIGKGVEVLCLSDHDAIQSSLFAREYVYKMGIPIEIVIGAEVTTYSMRYRDVHIGAYNIKENIPVGLTPQKAIDEIHKQGGIAVLNHPIYYSGIVPMLLPMLDGVEIYNHCVMANYCVEKRKILMEDYGWTYEMVSNINAEGAGYFEVNDDNIIKLHGSDNHRSYEAYSVHFPFTPDSMEDDVVRKFIGRG